jgi:murein DD-endopeptidase MepM/ murein hydrolase activator NlpD
MRPHAIIAFLLCCFGCDKSAAGGAAGSARASASAPAASAPVQAAVPASAALSALPNAPPPKADPSRLALEGAAVQGGLIRAKLNGKLKRMEFPGHKAIVSEEGEFLVAFNRDAAPQHKLTISLDDGSVLEHVFEVEQRTYETDKIDGLPDSMVNLDPKTRVELAKTEDQLEKLRNGYNKKPCYRDGFIWPAHGKITSRYGQPRVLNGTDGGIHWGVDIAAKVGTPVKAPACGKVIFAKTNVPLSGNTVIIDHGHGLTSTFLHLNNINTKVGAELKQGAVFGTVGNTGRTSGPHLDWRMNLFATRVDPELLVPPMK